MSKFQILHKTIDQHLLKERINVNVLEDYVNQHVHLRSVQAEDYCLIIINFILMQIVECIVDKLITTVLCIYVILYLLKLLLSWTC